MKTSSRQGGGLKSESEIGTKEKPDKKSKSEDKNASDEESPVKKRLKESSLFCGQNEVILY